MMKQTRIGTIHDDRTNANVLKDQFRIDEHSFTDLIGYISSFLKQINYYNLENKKEGKWDGLVNHDPIFLIVSVINHPIQELQRIANYYSETASGDSNLPEVTKEVEAWITRIEWWESQLRNVREETLANKIRSIRKDMLYGVSKQIELTDTNSKKQVHPQEENVSMEKILLILIKVVMLIQDTAKSYLYKNLYQRSDLKPHTATYITFALLFKRFQENINQLSQKHLDFYYKTVLKEKLGEGKDGYAVVSFALQPNVEKALVPKNLKLSAGKPFGGKTELFFYTKRPLIAHQIAIDEINTLCFNASKVIDYGVQESLITSVSKSNVWNNGTKNGDIEDWQLFGAQKNAEWDANIQADQVGHFGFIIQSPVLLLEEGVRTITLHLQLADNAHETLWKYIGEMASSRRMLKSTVIADVFESGLLVYHSAKKEWCKVEHCQVTGNEEDNSISIDIKLGMSDPAVEEFKENNSLTWPALKIMLNEYAPVYLYSFLKDVDVENVDIRVDVSGVKNLVLYNNLSVIAPGKAFELFGPIPEKGSYFMLGKSELAIKQLSSLELELKWKSLPTEEGGLTSYYSAYSYPFENESFQLKPQVLHDGVWNNLAESTIPLFQEKTVTNKSGYEVVLLDDITKLNISLDQFEWVNPSALSTPLSYEVNSIAGFFKFVLTNPEPGFGFDLYQKDFTEVALRNAKSKIVYPYPNKPIAPTVDHISLNYSASDKLVFNETLGDDKSINRGVFQQITPFAVEDVINNHVVSGSKLLFNYQNQAYFFMGLSNVVEEEVVSIYFQLFTVNQSIASTSQTITWEYFDRNSWHSLQDSDIIIDGTSGFLKSGIIELTLPKASKETIDAQGGRYWLRVSTTSEAGAFPKVTGIYMNATVAYAKDTPPELRGKPVPNGSIHKIVTKQPAIKEVIQPSYSRAGIQIESNDEYYLRISEHLRHKGRAVSAWDYEHLILERFKGVFAAKCTNLNDDFEPVPGKVSIIVLSKYWTNENRYYYNSDQLSDMRQYLLQRSNRFAQIKVVNPVEEYLLINVAAQFKKEDVDGYYLERLNTDLISFLSPNSFVNNGLAGIGGSIARSSIVSFVQNLYYISYVKYLSVEHIVERESNRYVLSVYEGNEEIVVSTPSSMLISVERHNIKSITGNNVADMQTGIGEMEIGLDLVLAEEEVQTETTLSPSDSHNETLVNDSIFVFKKSNRQ